MMHPGARAQIRSARRSNGLSLRELGRRTGVTASLLSQIENGKSDPSVSTLSALVSELGLSLDALLRSEWAALDERPAPTYRDMYHGQALNGDTRHDDGAVNNGTAARSNGIPLGGRSDHEESPVIRPPERQT